MVAVPLSPASASWPGRGGETAASGQLSSAFPDGEDGGMVATISTATTSMTRTGELSARAGLLSGIRGTLAIATLHRSSGSMVPSRSRSSHSAGLPVAGRELSGDKLSAGLSDRTTGDRERLPIILDILPYK